MPRLSEIIPAVILDWAGTTVDFGCMAPLIALQTVCGRHGVNAPTEEIRAGMGLPKRQHLHGLLSHYGVSDLTDQLYPELEQEILVQVASRSELIPGVPQVHQWLRSEGVKIGTTTGYTAAMMKLITPTAAAQGYVPDVVITPDDVPAGRPSPLMIYANALKLGAWPLKSFVKIGDTPTDVQEGRNAGTWTIGLALTGNALGLTETELRRLTPATRASCFSAARSQLISAGAHEVIDEFHDVPAALGRISRRIATGERPA